MYKYLREKFYDLTLARKFVLLYILLISISFALSAVTLDIGLSVYDDKLYEKSLQELDFFSQQVDDELDGIQQMSYILAVDSAIQKKLAEMQRITPEDANYFMLMYELRLMIANKFYYGQHILNVIYTDPHGYSITVGTATPPAETERYQQMHQMMDEAHGGYVMIAPDDGYSYLLSGRNIYKHFDMSLDELGSVILTSKVSSILDRQIANLSFGHSDLLLLDGDTPIYQSGELQAFSKEDLLGGQGYKIVRHEGRRYFLCYLTSARTGWRFVNLFPYDQIFGQTLAARYAVFLGAFLLILLSSWTMTKLARLVTRPLQNLSQSMRVVETGDFVRARKLLPEQNNLSETGVLTSEFSAMLGKIDELIRENYEKALVLQKTRYKMLQAQINPHFLNNTLNTLRWLVQGKQNEEANQMILALGNMLHASLLNEAYTTVAVDVQMTESYIEIQRLRYQNRAVFHIEVSGDLERYYLPHITLQPLVENAITHGVENTMKLCTISVRIVEESDSILMEVTDNGPGMPPERLETVRRFTAKPHGHGIGLKNIHDRLDMSFRPFAFMIDSKADQYTTVHIRIPKKTMEELYVPAADRR